MSQFDFGTLDPDVESGTDLATDLNSWRTALHSSHAGGTRPTYAIARTMWVKTVSATAEEWYLYDGTDDILIGTFNPTANTFTPSGALTTAGGTLTGAINEAPYVDVATASTANIFAAASMNIRLTGITTVTAFDTVAAGRRRKCRVASAFTITHNATTLICPGGANISAVADDEFEVVSLGSGNSKISFYQRADGTALVESAVAGGFDSLQVFTSSGTFTPPSGCTNVFVEAWGGDGGGGGITPGNTGGGGGGGSGACSRGYVAVTPAVGVTVTVGAAGAGSSGTGGTGGTTSFGTSIVAVGGTGGGPSVGTAGGVAGQGGSSASGTGTHKISGYAGRTGQSNADGAAGGDGGLPSYNALSSKGGGGGRSVTNGSGTNGGAGLLLVYYTA